MCQVKNLCIALLLGASIACTSKEVGHLSPPEPVLEKLKADSTASLRGCDTAEPTVVWVSGTQSTILRSVDGGVTWTRIPAPEEGLDFRDVEVFGAGHAYLLSAGPAEASRIYLTTDGGVSWQLHHLNREPEGFLNGLAFWDQKHGVAFGDPIDGRMVLLRTNDGGENWILVDSAPQLAEGEYAFAASGSSIRASGNDELWIVTGGSQARLFHSPDRGDSWKSMITPVPAGAPSRGIFSLALSPDGVVIVVGGDYQQPDFTGRHTAYSHDGGQTWSTSEKDLPYRSSVVHSAGYWITAGINGVDWSADDGRLWNRLADEGFHTLCANAEGTVFAAGGEGRLGRIQVPAR